MKKVITLMTILLVIATLSIPAFAGSPDSQQSIENSIISDTNSDMSVSNSESADDAVLKSDVKSFKGKFSGLFNDLNTLRAECKNLWTSIKTANQDIKNEWKNLKESLKGKNKDEVKKVLDEYKAKADSLRTQVKTLHSDIKTIRTQKATEWTYFKTGVKERDESKASTALNNIINLKKQIIERQKSILLIKQEILELFKS